MPFSTRRHDDADVIRARLRRLLAEAQGDGWVPDDDADDVGWAEPAPVREPDGPLPRNSGDVPAGLGRHRLPAKTVRWSPGPLGARSLWAVGLAAALLLAAWTWWDRPQVEPVRAPAPASTSSSAPTTTSVGEVARTSSTVVVSVVGQVVHPGLVTLPTGARVADAIDAAGGLLPGADPASVNLAAVVADGEQIAVGLPGVPAVAGPGASSAPGGGLVNLNTATAAELDALPGIGPVLAERILAYRTDHGPFASVDALDDVPGIGPAIAAELAELVTV